MGHNQSAAAANAVADRQERMAQIRCPNCRQKNVTIVVGQYSYSTQDYDPEHDDWSCSDPRVARPRAPVVGGP